MARPNQEAIETFMSITGESEAVAVQKLQVVRAVGGKIPALFDGGVRQGTYIFKALALGAQAVTVGRPVIYGLAAK